MVWIWFWFGFGPPRKSWGWGVVEQSGKAGGGGTGGSSTEGIIRWKVTKECDATTAQWVLTKQVGCEFDKKKIRKKLKLKKIEKIGRKKIEKKNIFFGKVEKN